MQMSMGVIIKGATAAGTLRGEMSDGTYGYVHLRFKGNLEDPRIAIFYYKGQIFLAKKLIIIVDENWKA